MTKEQKIEEALYSCQTIGALANMILVEYSLALQDNRFNMPVLNQKAKRIKQDTEDMIKQLKSLVYVKDAEYAEVSQPAQMHRVMKYLAGMDPEQIEQFMDKLENI